ncbi:RES family NAD+ phosphorylase [Nakamurella sp. UYEF19]|uniref:RES family NAD+ phosphorylase n=1 Tax=Nakamurella sp. UYEF19 TaxID=1756392 RepID=UPI003399EE61
MPDIPPPETPPGEVQLEIVPIGTPVRRIHGVGFTADQMNPIRQETELAGGRFDSIDGDYSYLYFAGDLEGAMAERVSRDLPLDGRPRRVQAASWNRVSRGDRLVVADRANRSRAPSAGRVAAQRRPGLTPTD